MIPMMRMISNWLIWTDFYPDPPKEGPFLSEHRSIWLNTLIDTEGYGLAMSMNVSASKAATRFTLRTQKNRAVGLALLYVFWTKRRGGFQNLRTAFAPLPGTPSAFDSPFGGNAWSQPETPGVSNAPPSFEDHVANPMRGGYEAPGMDDPEGV